MTYCNSMGGTPSRRRAAETRDRLYRVIKVYGPIKRGSINPMFKSTSTPAMDKHLKHLKGRGRIEMAGHGVWVAKNRQPLPQYKIRGETK